MSAEAELTSIINDIRLNFDRGQGTLKEVADRVREICRRVELEKNTEHPDFDITLCQNAGPHRIGDCPGWKKHD